MQLRRPPLASGILCVLTALYLLAFTNLGFWQKLYFFLQDHPGKLAVLAGAVLLLYIAIITLFSAKYMIKPVLIFLVLVAAGGSYFSDTFGTIIDRNVIEAALTTTQAESSHLITPRFIIHMLLFGVLPSALIIWIRVIHRPILKKVLINTVAILACLVGAVALIGSDFGSYSSLYRSHRSEFMGRLMPVMPIKSTIEYLTRNFKERDIVLEPLGLDAHQMLKQNTTGKPLVTVIVVGETARAQSFSLNGYSRETNPELKKRDIITFTNTTSCGTETSVSLPCMFSPFPRKDYSKAKFLGSENLVDVLQHAGVEVVWGENNTGSKRVADRIPMVDLQASNDARYCGGGECLDQILIDYLVERLDNVHGNATIILHMTGSHGPAYYKRYPVDAAIFQPECRTAQFSDCTREQIVNSYDNTIVYTDRILSEVIDVLKANENRFTSSMLYMSDHGESLGEDGLYLHAAPYFIAPDVQTHIPFITWFSPDYAKATGLDTACLKAGAQESASHDNLFHTVLGMMGVETSVYDAQLDRFGACRGIKLLSAG